MGIFSKLKNSIISAELPKLILITSKIEIFNFELEEKINHPLRVKFHGESSGDNLNAQKLNYNTLLALIGPNYKIWKFRLV